MLKNKIHNTVFLILTIGLIIGWIFFDVSIWLFVALLVLSFGIKLYASFTIGSQYYVHAICNGNPDSKSVALTFDDGPIPGKTERILDILKEKKVPAAFFCIGSRVDTNLDLLKRIDGEGHLVANHSYHHKKTFSVQNIQVIADELIRTRTSINAVIGKNALYFRPPFGVTNPLVAAAVQLTGHTVIGWNVRSLDTVTKTRNALWKRITKNLSAGDIVLFHDYPELTLEILPDYIDHIRKSGLKIVRLDELIGIKPYA